MHKYIIMGVQGCGKGTQAKMLAQKLDLVHISVGDIFRWHIQSHTKLAARIRRVTAAGELVSDDIVEEVIHGGWSSTTGTTASSWTAFRAIATRPSSFWRATISTPCC